ncbi:hypothetical protein J3U21_00600 [Gilliamella sp. B2776]|uniref:hypothetical protein n=1 Tax=unclassified Gilliamella TaxID=2685620 RepID=UPI002269B1F9|nr:MULTISPECIES: hypothetical protein [unclassified Gilliamella]MCX8648836.1 hypothetical protein [Gilliamella sp. B2779]MCX8653288.1 hypothetical protein [Gilliamella sp. B2737]MCX8655564.1 hypothetical protein [Gilliamella sp. B2894]MCX8664314.1 hypothetical protein [Gilliamella sp. B2887]MCX8690648.1 hypothetical protein [Gilliamella sp. B2776]
MTNQPKKIILDYDLCHHDTFAILLAQGDPDIELAAIKPLVKKVDIAQDIYNDSNLDRRVQSKTSIQLNPIHTINLYIDSLNAPMR